MVLAAAAVVAAAAAVVAAAITAAAAEDDENQNEPEQVVAVAVVVAEHKNDPFSARKILFFDIRCAEMGCLHFLRSLGEAAPHRRRLILCCP